MREGIEKNSAGGPPMIILVFVKLQSLAVVCVGVGGRGYNNQKQVQEEICTYSAVAGKIINYKGHWKSGVFFKTSMLTHTYHYHITGSPTP